MGNAQVLGGTAQVDGLKFLFRKLPGDLMGQHYRRIFDIVQDATGLPTATLNRLVKLKAVRGEHTEAGALWSLTLVGDAARVYQVLPWSITGALVEMHVKTYLHERAEGAYEAFGDATWEAPTVVNLSRIKSKPRKGSSKGTGAAGVRIGSRKSDKHAVAYRRVGELVGLEARVRDQELKKAVAMVEHARAAVAAGGTDTMSDPSSWHALKAVVSAVGYNYVLTLLRKMGVNIAEYFTHADRHPRSTMGQGNAALDPDEELTLIMPHLGE